MTISALTHTEGKEVRADYAKKLEALHMKRLAAVKRYNKAIAGLDKQVDAIRRNCKHDKKKFHFISGGNYSFYECDICGETS